MGDLIHKLPTDENNLSREEKQNLLLLFGKEEPEEEEQSPSVPIRTATPIPDNPNRPLPVATLTSPPSPIFQLRQEIIQVALIAGVFCLFQFSFVDSLLSNYLPLCKADAIRNVAKSVLFGIVIWILVNRKYIR